MTGWKLKLAGALAGLVLASGAAMAQAPNRMVGTIEADNAGVLTVKPATGDAARIALTSTATVFALERATLADIKPGTFAGVGAMQRDDGAQRAMQIVIFAEPLRGLGEGFRPWNRGTGSTMTNATVTAAVTSVDGPSLMMKYPGGEQRIVIPADAVILALVPADKAELKPGAAASFGPLTARADGVLEAPRATVGRGGVVPF